MLTTAPLAFTQILPSSPRNAPPLSATLNTLAAEILKIQQSLYAGYYREQSNVGRASANAFNVSGNQGARYTIGTTVRLNGPNNSVVATVIAVNAGGTTLVTISGAVVPDPLVSVDIAIFPRGTESAPVDDIVLNDATLNNPTVNNGIFSAGTYTNIVLNTPIVSGGTYSNGTFNNPVLNTPTLNTPNIKASKLTVLDLGSVNGNVNIDFSAGNYFLMIPSGALTIVPQNVQVGRSVVLAIRSGQVLTWFNTIAWDENTPPVRTSTPNRYDIFQFTAIKESSGNFTYLGSRIGKSRIL